ncbi:hypothetical protein OG413_41345 [Streptomyces sp. NBC_01433]|uniref:hypothetical protein n=1 Tax=Streptomyces sp. NBC_01433 TaxID=2903864 RepID=UPI00224FE7A2|nr:hypothetical protein [Streptomyces sp. NBC_01433]MCX4681649.1 hypothetical protein [Streptomyces sp. NBC_01433]
MTPEAADWILSNVLPALYRNAEGAEELRTCVCQAPPSNWLGGIQEPEARLWDRDGRKIADAGALIVLWRTEGTCTRRGTTPWTRPRA